MILKCYILIGQITKKLIIFLKIFPKFSEKITEFSQNFQKILEKITAIFRKNYSNFQKKITIKPVYIVSILTKNL